MADNMALIAGGVAVLAIAAGAYLYLNPSTVSTTVYNSQTVYTTTGGGGSNGGTPAVVTGTPGLIFANATVYNPSQSLIIAGTGFTPNAPVNITVGSTSQSTTTNFLGNFGSGIGTDAILGVSFDVSSYKGTITAQAYQGQPQVFSNTLTLPELNITSVTDPTSPNVSTTSPGNNLQPSQWTYTGSYGSNTNPVSFSNWAVKFGTYWGSNFKTGPGYYQNDSSNAEIYCADTNAQISFLQGLGYPTTSPLPVGDQNALGNQYNPYPANSNGTLTWVAAGYYVVPKFFSNAGLPAGTDYIATPATITNYNSALASSVTTQTSNGFVFSINGNSAQNFGSMSLNQSYSIGAQSFNVNWKLWGSYGNNATQITQAQTGNLLTYNLSVGSQLWTTLAAASNVGAQLKLYLVDQNGIVSNSITVS